MPRRPVRSTLTNDDSIAEDAGAFAVLDDQEQEEVVEELKNENEKHNLLNIRQMQGILAGAILLQTIFFLGYRETSSWTPFAPLFSPSSPQPLIALPRLWNLLTITQHAHDVLLLQPSPPAFLASLSSAVSLPPKQRLWPITLLPTLLFFSTRQWNDYAQLTWWCFGGTVAGVTGLVRRWIDEGLEDLRKLDALKYERKAV